MEQVSAGYATGQLAAAFVTAATHEDPATRRRAEERVRRWSLVLSGGHAHGSRTPVKRFPAWVTLDVMRGGFATGEPAAGGPLRPHEARFGSRAAAFAHYLTDAGLAELHALLDSGDYRIDVPEQGALPAVASLLRAGDRAAALDVLDAIGPFADRLCFTPVPERPVLRAPDVVWRAGAGEVGAQLAARTENPRVAAQREALTVWNPLADEFLTLWLDFDAGRARDLLARYRELAARHTRSRKHLRRKENLYILRTAAEHAVAGRELTPRHAGLLRVAIAAMTAKRGRPGSPEHTALRTAQARHAGLPGHHQLAHAVAARLDRLDPRSGVADTDAVCAPVHGTPVPDSIRRVVRRATAGTIPELIRARVVPSAEVLARLTPQITSVVEASGYSDPVLMAAVYRAFRNRRSLLLLDYAHQVRIGELPWVAAQRTTGPAGRDETVRRLGSYYLTGFPGTITPNPLVAELSTLSPGLPWVEELAADIFMGGFTPKFGRAAALAGELLAGSLYQRYYGVDWSRAGRDFARHCRERAGSPRGSVAANGAVIEQGQIVTTHNLATLAYAAGAVPEDGWRAAADGAFGTVLRLAARPAGLRTRKDIAYAWRQVVFFLSVPGAGDPQDAIAAFHGRLAAGPGRLRERVLPVVTGLAEVAAGAHGIDPLLGWVTRR
ncbi:hypothetical protein J2S43_001738 [Catenuloplanes nepalensis]|uniref:Uncharacterized protein n=1 Tax=Catenuloplanes nepalensis TaxID=587533 RepID=A0ABT9MP78_9ACTN|nr:hypothetical protein [Catenuloplanes nepalensis]MDP9793226.1 hypothetical protein [Catenuloplanes nepalensis]